MSKHWHPIVAPHVVLRVIGPAVAFNVDERGVGRGLPRRECDARRKGVAP